MSGYHIIEEAFGKNCNLYTDVLECPRDANSAALRRAYYRTALKYHPDKVSQQQPNAIQKANEKFHAITAVYQILCNAELRKEYDTTGIIPDTNNDDDDDDEFNSNNSNNPWKEYFDRIFGKVTNNDIDVFASKYKCSEEEQRDVLHQYVQQKGNLSKMLHHVMLSENIDVIRWVHDYINPSILNQTLTSQYNDTMQRTLQQIQTKIEKERKKKDNGTTKKTTKNDKHKKEEHHDDEEEEDDDEDYDDEHDDMDEEDDDETETDEDVEPPSSPPPRKSPVQKKTQPSVKTKRTMTKAATANTKKSKNDATDLISLIQNKHRNSAATKNSTWSDFGARYGVTMPEEDDDDDPLRALLPHIGPQNQTMSNSWRPHCSGACSE